MFIRDRKFVRRGKSRGYNFEKKLETYFNLYYGWYSKRLAPTSISMPDVVVTYQDKIFCLEAKATQLDSREIELRQFKNSLYNPDNYPVNDPKIQIPLIDIFPLYKDKYICGTWYFSEKTTKGETRNIRIITIVYEHNTFKELYRKYKDTITAVSCNYNGLIRYQFNKQYTKGIKDVMNKTIKQEFPYKIFYDLKTFKNHYENGNTLISYFKKD